MATQKPWFVIAGGGTGGHIYPGLAVAETLRSMQAGFQVSVFGTPRPIDRKLIQARNYELIEQAVRPIPKMPWKLPGFWWSWRRSVLYARHRFEERPPVAVLGVGGYAAAPAIVAAAKLNIPTAIFNPDAMPGLANRKLANRVDRIFIQWHETAEFFNRSPKVQCTGCPIRPDFARVTRDQAIRTLKLDPNKKTILITGASQGAGTINAAVTQLIDLWQMAVDWQIIHLTGPTDLEMCRERYRQAGINALIMSFTEEMASCMAAADLVLSRAGASTLAEIMAMGVPAILMPYPYDLRQHQRANAQILVDNHAAVLVEDAKNSEINERRLRKALGDIMNSDHRRQRMAEAASAMGRHDAALVIAESILEMIRNH